LIIKTDGVSLTEQLFAMPLEDKDHQGRTRVYISNEHQFVNQDDRGGVPDLSVSGDNFDLVEVDPHDPTTTSEPEAPMQSLNQLPMVTNLTGARSA
jgi:hypothetical protein